LQCAAQKTTDENHVEHLSVVMTTDDVSHTTGVNVATSSSRGIEFYFQCAVVVIGIVGTAANALILYALVASAQHKKHVLIFNQNLLDFSCCLLLVISHLLKLSNVYLTGSGGYWICMLFRSENLIWCLMLASKMNLMIVTIERYLKVVYPKWSKKKLQKWVLISAAAFAWISGIVHSFALTFGTSDMIDGVCEMYTFWKSQQGQAAYGIWYVLSFYITVLALFIFCYWRILAVIRRQARVMAAHSAAGPSTAAQTQSSQMQTNVIKTMILVSAFYAVCDMPMNVYYLILTTSANITLYETGYYVYNAAMFMSFLYICANPFIYATKFDPVKRVLLSLIPCVRMIPVQPTASVEMSVSHTATRTAQSPK